MSLYRQYKTRVQELCRGARWRTIRIMACYPAMLYSLFLKNVTFVGITGSAGKTTTKDLAAALLSTMGACTYTSASFNEANGVSRTVLRTSMKDRFCVLEVAGGRPGDMDWPLKIFTPNIAVLTIIEKEHIKSSLGFEVVLKEKRRLVDALPEDGVAILNIDDPLVRSVGEECGKKVIWVGAHEDATIRLLGSRCEWPEPLVMNILYEGRDYEVRTRLYGEHLSLSVISALGVGIGAGMSMADAISAIETVPPASGRMQVVESDDGVLFVRDDWKAPYWSFESPIRFMEKAKAARKVIIIGTLSDYSLSASKVYPKVAEKARLVADLTVFVGPHALRALNAQGNGEGGEIRAFPDIADAAHFLRTALKKGDLVLLKGTNKADHLVRLYLDRNKPVACWRDRCRLGRFCTNCPKLYDYSEPVGEKRRLKEFSHEGQLALDVPCRGMPIVIGLGNPGEKYDGARHNVGYAMVDRISSDAGSTWEVGKYCATSIISVDGFEAVLLKPQVPINRSGAVIHEFLKANGVSLSQCLVVHDDLDIPLGDVRLKRSGGDAGHLGVRSVVSALGSGNFCRLRVGARDSGDDRDAKLLVHEKVGVSQRGRDLESVFSKVRPFVCEFVSNNYKKRLHGFPGQARLIR